MYKIFLLIISILSLVNAKQIVIATGGVEGNYFTVGKDINHKVYNGKAKVINTQGSVENMLLVANGNADIAFVQADALGILETFYMNENKSQSDLVEVIGKIYNETVHILVKKDSDINTIEELNHKIIASGGLNSGSTVTASSIAEEYGIQFGYNRNCSIKEGLKLLQQNKIDALFYVTKSPSNTLKKYKDFRMLKIVNNKHENSYLKHITVPRKTYKFLDNDTQTYSVDTIVIIKKGSNEKYKIKKYLKTIGKESQIYSDIKIANTQNKKISSFLINQDIMKKFTKRYGNGALVRLNYLDRKIQRLKNEKLVTQLSEINKIINRIQFKSDRIHWKEENYWATPLETLGTGYADKEDIALLKYILLVKVGLNPNNIKLIEKKYLNEIEKKVEEDIALLYFHKKEKAPIVLDYTNNNEKIYKYKKQFKYKVIKKAQNKLWDTLFATNVKDNDLDDIMNVLGKKR